MPEYTDKFPKYRVVDFEIYVKLEARGSSILAFNHTGNPYPVRKALAEGNETTEEEFEKAVKRAKRKNAQQEDIKV